MSTYTIFTWNVRGIHTPKRRYSIYSYLKRHSVHIAFLQDTHLALPEVSRLRRRWRGQLNAMGYSTFAKGALIWIRPGVPFVEEVQIVDDQGRYVLVQGHLAGRALVLGSIYAPNSEQASFFHILSCQLSGWSDYPWLLGWDFNSVLDPILDFSFSPLPTAPTMAAARALSTWATNWRLLDI
ncbi:hypothetical protein NDU88_003524 [Pleurodeles waltl]|uniref:exodeoxyribonuclease III n=1 Tax=Pleurodeles waltl TaxID=8319 RepID=A0AAV7MBB6_PLEWA|nr:hypothetical protein NDU88_003524 [Pleurodeles waltl]